MRLEVLFWILLVIGIAAFIFDPIVASSVSQLRHPFVDGVEELLTLYITPLVLVVLFGLFLFVYRRKEVLSYAASVLIACVSVVLLKVTVMRPRPFEVLDLSLINNFSGYVFDAWNSSFPSWHAASVFVILPFVSKKYQFVWFVFALLYALVRVSAGVHYVSDVLLGAALGVGIGMLGEKYVAKLKISTHS